MVYPRTTGFAGVAFRTVRTVVPHLPRWLQMRIADVIVPLLGFLPTASGVSLQNASWRACREVVRVNITPRRILLPTRAELEMRLEAEGCEFVFIDDGAPLTFWARKHGEHSVE